MNIVLIGYRGTGKTSAAKNLSEKLKMEMLSTDALIELHQKKTIKEIVDTKGWDYFRDEEEKVIADISLQDNKIIDCGGGAVLRKENIKNLKKNGKIFLLISSPAAIKKRIKDSKERPSLTKEKDFIEEIEDVLKSRKEAYAQAADVVIDTEILTPEQIADNIIKYLKMIGEKA